MSFLIDTHVFIWALTDTRRLSSTARGVITNPSNELYISAVTFWEIAIKLRSKRLAPIGHEPSTLIKAAETMGFTPIPITPEDATTHAELTENTHFDPFDRMLIWQAIQRDMTLLSGDPEFKKFKSDGLRLLWK